MSAAAAAAGGGPGEGAFQQQLHAAHALFAPTSSSSSSPSGGAPGDYENPYSSMSFEPARAISYGLTGTVVAHGTSVSAVAFHPTAGIAVTASDDATWKAWTVDAVPQKGAPTARPARADLLMTGTGHSSWLSDAEFKPSGDAIATSSGDGAVKIWSISALMNSQQQGGQSQQQSRSDASRGPPSAYVGGGGEACITLVDHGHTQTAWGVSWHCSGDYLCSGGMDHTARLWDVGGSSSTGRVITTLRGHLDSVNAVAFQPVSAAVATASGDKTVSLWDTRTGMCVQTFFGHANSVSDVVFALQGDVLASCDADGVIREWDTRMVAERGCVQACICPVNALSYDRSGRVLAAACEDGIVRILQHRESGPGGALGSGRQAAGAGISTPPASRAGNGGAAGYARGGVTTGIGGANGAGRRRSSGGGAGDAALHSGGGGNPLEVVASLVGHTDAVQGVEFDSSSAFLVSVGNDGTMRLWSDWDFDVATA